MADDAVRRTPRPDEVPPLWWSPTKREVYWLPDPTSVNVWTLELADESLPSDQLPADAVQLVGPDQRRPVVLLRAEDCACPVGGDCPHGPEPVDALDLAVWLHAEAQHRLTEEQAASYRMYARVFKALGVSVTAPWSGLADAAAAVVAERDALQARLNALQRWLRTEVTVGWIQPRGYRERYLAEDVIRGLIAGEAIAMDQQDTRTASSGPTAQGIPADSGSTVEVPSVALQGDQPAEPDGEGVPCSEGCGMYYTGPLPIPDDHDHRHNAAPSMAPCPGRFIAEPTGEVDRG